MVEVKEPAVFDSERLTKEAKSIDIGLVSQPSLAKKTINSIDQFLGFFKILESLFPKNQQELKDCLKNDSDLYSIYKKTFTLNDDKIVRNHFQILQNPLFMRDIDVLIGKQKRNWIRPIDPKIKEEVEPFLTPLAVLTYECINYFSK